MPLARMPTCVLRRRHRILRCKIFCDARKTFSGKARCRRAHHFNPTTQKPCARVPSMRPAVLMRSRRSFFERWVLPIKCSPPSHSRKAWMMGSEFEMAGLDASERSGERFCSIRVSGRRRFNILPASAIPILLGLGSSANAQAIPWVNGEFASPWNAQKIFRAVIAAGQDRSGHPRRDTARGHAGEEATTARL